MKVLLYDKGSQTTRLTEKKEEDFPILGEARLKEVFDDYSLAMLKKKIAITYSDNKTEKLKVRTK